VSRTLAWFAVAVIAFLVAHPQMLGVGGEVLGPGWDATRVFWADLAFVRHALHEGSLPLWNPYDRGGYAFAAEPQSGCFDPLTLLLVGLAALIGHTPAWLIMLKAVLCYGIAGAGMAAFLRHHQLPSWAVGLGTAVIVLAPRMDKLKDQSALWPTVWIGALLLALDRCLIAPSWRRGLWLGVAAALMVDAGYPPTVFRMLLLLLPYAIWRLWVTARERAERAERRAYFVALGRALAVTSAVVVVLCAAQVWATLGVLPDTTRAQLELGHVLASRTVPEHWRGLVAPLETTTALLMYVGVATGAGMLAAFAVRPRGLVLVLVGVGVFGFVLACGENLPVLPALADLPGFRAFRIAGHYLTLVPIAAAILGAIGLAKLADEHTPRWLAPVVALVVIAMALTFNARDDLLSRIIGVASGLSVAALGLAPTRWRPKLGWLVVGLLCLELWVVGRPVAEILQPVPDAVRSREMAGALHDRVGHRIADFGYADNRPGPREAVRDLIGHRPALTDPRYLLVYAAVPGTPSLLEVFNVEVVGFEQQVARRRPRMQVIDPASPGLYRLRAAWPLAFWTADVSVVEDTDAALELLSRAHYPAAVFEAAHVDGGIAALAEQVADVPPYARPREVAATLTHYGINTLSLAVDAPARGVLVIAEAYAEGWTARVDGELVPLRRANMILRALELEPGAHAIELRYEPPGVVALWALWCLAWLGILGLLAYDAISWWTAKRRGRP
jgi:hypothetical protein